MGDDVDVGEVMLRVSWWGLIKDDIEWLIVMNFVGNRNVMVYKKW